MNTFPGSAPLLACIFGIFVGATAAGGVIAVLTHRIIRAVCGLALCSVGLAGLYYFLNSPFLALMEILIYIGAVCVTIIFAVMLAEPDEPQPDPGDPDVIAMAVALDDSIVTEATDGLQIVDLTTPTAPVLANQLPDFSNPALEMPRLRP